MRAYIDESQRNAAPGLYVLAGVVVRPEQISLAPGGDPASASVISRTFLGEKTEYQVQAGTATLHAVAYGAGTSARLAEGQAVQVVLPAEGNAIIRD